MSLGKVSPPEISASAPWGDDPLSKQREGRILSNLICSLGDSAFVISLKGGWGTGKSIFLKRLGYHLENSRKVPVIKIDAWQTDYIDDPLLALTSALNERIQKTQSRSRRRQTPLSPDWRSQQGKLRYLLSRWLQAQSPLAEEKPLRSPLTSRSWPKIFGMG